MVLSRSKSSKNFGKTNDRTKNIKNTKNDSGYRIRRQSSSESDSSHDDVDVEESGRLFNLPRHLSEGDSSVLDDVSQFRNHFEKTDMDSIRQHMEDYPSSVTLAGIAGNTESKLVLIEQQEVDAPSVFGLFRPFKQVSFYPTDSDSDDNDDNDDNDDDEDEMKIKISK